ncbi:MAG: LPS export ABC transporter periplasmic protein LptC [Alphaproteobacteria bacterium]|uniref:LPS export ABC transporter periplasmic protein LptC n=1 Tax=Pacificispira sp. TaxID=2888761 RepID=UPI001B1B589D|nr:LPS export ABC transporter periplasmic protein LptC [Alphaproteobacteria bacterium]MBO6862950.1 LPS export ABC transporter periplasmic protein LptC [Alphaproteobacteria bacterium]
MASTDTRQGDPTPKSRGAGIPLSVGQRRHSRGYGMVVGWLKVLLPTLAVVLIALVIIWPYLEDEGRRITDTLTNAGQLISEHLEVNQARYSGVSEDGQRYTVTAETVLQQSVDAMMVAFTQPRADISLNDGSWALVTAETGTLDRETNVLELRTTVNLFHDQGYEFRTESATFDLMGGSAYGFDPVFGQGPFGYLQAEGFQATNRGERVQLTGKSKVVIYSTD